MSDSPAVIIYGTDLTGSIVEKGTEANPLGVREHIVSTGGFYPDYFDAMFSNAYGVLSTTAQDSAGNLKARSAVLTDEGSFRDDFGGSSLDISTITGTAIFTNGSQDVTGIGTLFTTELSRYYNIRLSTDPSPTQALIAAIVDDTTIILRYPYEGSTGTGSIVASTFAYVTGSGGSITVGSSNVTLTSGITSGTHTYIVRSVDYGPLVLNAYVSTSTRQANQEYRIGLVDDPAALTNFAYIVFDGTDNTKGYLQTGGNAGDVETSSVFTIPNSGSTDAGILCRIELSGDLVTAYVNNIALASNRRHIPGYYESLSSYAGIVNTGVPAGSSDFVIDSISVNNLNIVQVGGGAANQPLNVSIGGPDELGVYKIPTIRNTKPSSTDYSIVTRPFLPAVNSVSHGSEVSSGTGSSWTVLTSSAATHLTILNTSNADIEVRRSGAGVGLPVVANSYWVFRGISNANELSFRRIDQSNTQVTIYYETES
jgi:hypothetical protein